MQAIRTLLLLSLLLAACAPSAVPVGAAPAAGINLSTSQKAAVGHKIWQNESAGTVKGLTHWNEGEEFPSLGIGHFIWYPKGFQGRWTETFPEFVRYAQSRGVRGLPSVASLPDCPWKSRAAFYQDFEGPRLTSLRTWLAAHVTVQTDFIMAKSRAALPKVLAAAPTQQRQRIENNYDKVASTPNGIYALIDYVNFKGDGTNPTERYKSQGWGLLWVLQEMKEVPTGPAAAKEFGAAAARCLDRRIANSPPARGEKRWQEGWHNRCRGYGKPL